MGDFEAVLREFGFVPDGVASPDALVYGAGDADGPLRDVLVRLVDGGWEIDDCSAENDRRAGVLISGVTPAELRRFLGFVRSYLAG